MTSTPFGGPVVPDVYGSNTTSSGSTSRIGSGGPSSPRPVASSSGTPASGWVSGSARISSRGVASRKIARTSSSGRAGWIGAQIAPTAAVANTLTSAAGWFPP